MEPIVPITTTYRQTVRFISNIFFIFIVCFFFPNIFLRKNNGCVPVFFPEYFLIKTNGCVVVVVVVVIFFFPEYFFNKKVTDEWWWWWWSEYVQH